MNRSIRSGDTTTKPRQAPLPDKPQPARRIPTGRIRTMNRNIRSGGHATATADTTTRQATACTLHPHRPHTGHEPEHTERRIRHSHGRHGSPRQATTPPTLCRREGTGCKNVKCKNVKRLPHPMLRGLRRCLRAHGGVRFIVPLACRFHLRSIRNECRPFCRPRMPVRIDLRVPDDKDTAALFR